uniref:Coiled-coil domain-containing protein 162 n=1 Tax=Phallusia mammillata TaxID=59560 RepID=A0A6F9D8P6_9ASCI|nr:coiled-coil domain-containing protein 162 [Phallusia mammillata]
MEHYEVSRGEKVKLLEEELAKDISELKNEIEECEMSFGNFVRPMSTISSPMSHKYFQKEREITINNMLHIDKVLPLKNQGQAMITEMEAAINTDFNEKGLTLFLHQHYLDQIQNLVQCKHLHMLRWSRFCEHTDAIERQYPVYKCRLDDLNKEYSDSKNRAMRLSMGYHSYVLGEESTLKCIQPNDLLIYLRWLVTNLHITKKFSAYLKVLQWLPTIHKNNIGIQRSVNTKTTEVQIETGKVSFDVKTAWKHLAGSIPRSSGRQSSFAIATELAFSGFVSNETTLGVPVHMLELHEFRDQLEALAHEYGIPVRSEIITSADEMELFGAVNRRFKSLLNRQVECCTFYQYDNVPEGQEHWGVDSASHCLIKPENWCKYIKIKPQTESLQLRQMTTLKQKQDVDELLLSQNRFLLVEDHVLATESFKEHAVAVRDPPTVQVLQVTSHKQGKLKSTSVWKRIYDNASEQTASKQDGNNGNTSAHSKYAANKKRECYDYANTMQMLGLDEGEESSNQDPTIIQGAYLSFLHLRHLKIKDMKRQCLAILNYFRSVERSITIYDGGLSLQSKKQEQQDEEQNRSSSSNFTKDHKPKKDKRNGTDDKKEQGIGSHQYIFNTPADYKIDENRFMEFGGIENHDDFYCCDFDDNAHSNVGAGDGNEWQSYITAAVSSGTTGMNFIPHVQDQRGYYIVYDAALQDMKCLDEELLLVASHYIEKDTANRSVLRRSPTEFAQRRKEAPGEVDVAAYGHRDVDRFAVLLDMWTCEVNFLANKLKLLNCFYETYQNTFCSNTRRHLAQVMTNLLHQRPRYDFTQDYFVQTYKSECACLRLKTSILSQILTNQIDESRQYLVKVTRQPHLPGMPYHSTGKQEIATNTLRPALKYLDMFEFHPNLGVVSARFDEAILLTVQELFEVHHPSDMYERILLEKQVLEHAHREWEGLTQIGSSYSIQTQRNLFFDQYVEDPNILIEAVQSIPEYENEVSSDLKPVDQKESLQILKKCIEMVVLRHRLLNAAWETEILSRLYKQVATDMGFDEHHMHLRLVQFEFANLKEKIDLPPSMQSSFIPDDMSADRYIPAQLQLAIQEMDENHLPKFSFHSRDGILQILKNNGTNNLQVALTCQVVHKNALIVAVTMSNNCTYWKELKIISSDNRKETNQDVSDTKSSHSVSTTLTQGTVKSGTASPSGIRRGVAYSGKLKFGFDKQKRSPESFISIQMEKCGPRDVVVNAFVKKKETSGMLLKKPGEIEKLKRSLITDYCQEVSFRMSLHAMRAQIIAYYANILHTLQSFQPVRDNFFMVGFPNEKKNKKDDVQGMIPDPKSLHKRPRRVFSPDGKSFLNVWFIPHFSEILTAHRNLDYESQHTILTNWLMISSSLHDIVLYLCAHAHMGSTAMDKQILEKYTVSSDWGGFEGIGSEFREIQEQIDLLPSGPHVHTKDPLKVAEFLTLRKEAMYMQFEAAVRHMVRETFLAMENVEAFSSVTINMQHAFSNMNYKSQGSVSFMHFNLPQPLRADRQDSAKLFPWISFNSSNGPYPTSYPFCWRSIEPLLQLCLAGLSYTDRKIANGDILGVNLLLQEILKSGIAPLQCLHGTADEMPKGYLMLVHVGKEKPQSSTGKKKDASDDTTKEQKNFNVLEDIQPLCKLQQPIEAYRLSNTFLKLWGQLEILKDDWGKNKLQVQSIETAFLFRELQHIFRAEIVLPVFTSMARQMGYLDEYDDISKDEEPVKLPPHATELAVKARLLIKLLEILECKMITEVRQRVSREYTLVLAERSREENALPTDIWRHSMGENGVKENFTVSRPSIVEDFLQKLLSECQTQNGSVTFDKKHLELCISDLGSSVMQRERENYESYAMYYESLLRHYHHLLYLKELETKSLCGNSSTNADEFSSQFQLADRSHELILEITALRAKIAEMRDESLVMDQDIRDDVKQDYQDLVQNLFEVCFQMKARLSQCHLTIHDDIRSLVGETRKDAMKSLGKLKSESPSSTAEERLRTIDAKDRKIAVMQQDQYELNMLLSKLTALNHWKQTTTNCRYKAALEKLKHDVNRTRLDCMGKQMVAKEETDLFKEELASVRQSLNDSEKKLKKAHQRIEREMKMQKEKEYEELQEQKNRQQLEQARQRNMKRLAIELEEKNTRLRHMTVDLERSAQIEHNQQSKVQRSLKQMHAQLSMERNLKLDAFDRVDSLQAQVMETERDVTAPLIASSAVSPAVSRLAFNRSRPSSSYNSVKTPSVRVRPMSSVSGHNKGQIDAVLPRKRPQTAAGRLKNSIAAALLTEIYPSTDVHETVIQLDRTTN